MPQIILMGWFTQDKEDPQKPFLFTDQYDKNDNLNPQFQTKSFFRSMSSSRSCRNDPENNDYMICKQTVFDGNNKTETEERVPKANFGTGNLFGFFNSPDNAIANQHHSMLGNEFGMLDKLFEQMFFSPLSSNFTMFGNPQQNQNQMPFERQPYPPQQFYPQTPQQTYPNQYVQPTHQNQQAQYTQGDPSSIYFDNNQPIDYSIKDL